MKQVVGCFQFFYSSRDPALTCPDVPTRDVTNSARAGFKTEPLLEKRLENWCACRKTMVTPRVRDTLSVTATDGFDEIRKTVVIEIAHAVSGKATRTNSNSA